MLSLTEENYLKAIYHLSEGGTQPVLTNALAEAMSTKAASATDMIKKLSQKELITYEKYHGVNVTATGKTEALLVIRKHRLWETFLVQTLGFTWDEVHEIAEQLEHIHSQRLIDKLDAFLGYPQVDPHGDPIPDSRGKIKNRSQVPLDQMPVGFKGIITAVKDSDSNLLKYLDKIGARPGVKLQLTDKEAYDQSMEVKINSKTISLSKEVCKNILVNEP
ncbi:MAG: metal-dependent transcriptional regulator [Cyclobacteriaceae bacterium]|jgi:DtxR family Mn-dependent transcriptional regulator|nr:metal-dependent transcriptional regulator [Cyclobacteriaceae bacterium]